MAGYRHLELNEVGDVTVVHFRDQKIVEDLPILELGQELYHLVDVGNRFHLVLNFATVSFLSSAALGKLIGLHKRLMARGGTLKLCSIRPEIYEVFVITKLNLLFDIYPEESDALATA